MGSKDSAEDIDFDFFDDDDREPRYNKKTTSSRYDDDYNSSRRYDKHDRPSSGRPDSVRSTASSRSSLSVKIPSANPSPRDNSSSDDEDNYSPKHINGNHNDYEKYDKRKDKKNRSRSRSDSETEGSEKAKSTRPKTSKGSRSRYSSGSSSASKSSRSSIGSRSSKSDDYSSSHSSDSESVTDVSPMQSQENSRSPSPERRDLRSKNKNKQLKDSVRFEEPPRSGCVRPSASERSTRLAATEAQELSMLLKAVLEMEETPSRPNFHNFEGGVRSRPSSGKRPMSGKTMPHQRMNMSFSNDEVRRIDKDNQRLLQKIVKPSSAEKQRPQSGRMRTRSASYGSRPSSGHVSHSALLRQKEQRRIEMENMKILQRIEGAKPTSELQYHKLKKDFNKQQQYASQVSRTPVRPSSAKRSGTGKFPSGHGMSKASSMQSLRSDITTTSVGTSASSRNRSRPSSARPTWDDHWSCT